MDEESLFRKNGNNPDGLALLNLKEKINEIVDEINLLKVENKIGGKR